MAGPVLPVGSQTGIPGLALSTITTARGEDVHFLMHILAWMARYRTLRQGSSTRLKACLIVASSASAATTTLLLYASRQEATSMLIRIRHVLNEGLQWWIDTRL